MVVMYRKSESVLDLRMVYACSLLMAIKTQRGGNLIGSHAVLATLLHLST